MRLETAVSFGHSGLMKAKLAAWGGYDDSKPRVRLLLEALRDQGALASEIQIPAWRGVRDKAVAGKIAWFRALVRLIIGWPRAAWKLLQLPRGVDILLPFPGTPDVFIAAPLAKLSGRRIVLDAFLPIHDTIVRDRGMLKEKSWRAAILHRYEKLGMQLADIVITDTSAQGDFYSAEFGISRDKLVTVMVGAESNFTVRRPIISVDHLIGDQDGKPIVLFYGQLIPLHGVATILQAAQMDASGALWIFVGQGQDQPLVEQFMQSEGSGRVIWLPWVEYQLLPSLIARADICLGVFGSSGKAGRVIPNKVVQCLTMGKPVISREGPGVRYLEERFPNSFFTVPPANATSLAQKICELVNRAPAAFEMSDDVASELGPGAGVAELIVRLSDHQ